MHKVAPIIGTGRNILVTLLQHTRNYRRKPCSTANLPHRCTGAVAAVATAAGAAAAESAAERPAERAAVGAAVDPAVAAATVAAVAAAPKPAANVTAAVSFDTAGLRMEIRHGRALQRKVRTKGLVFPSQQQSDGLSQCVHKTQQRQLRKVLRGRTIVQSEAIRRRVWRRGL